MRAHLQRAGPNLTSSPTPFQIRFVSPSTALQQDLSPDLAACGCRKKQNKTLFNEFPSNETKRSVLCFTFWPPSASPLSQRNHQRLQLVQMRGQTGAGFRVSDEQGPSPVGHHHQSAGEKTTSGLRDGCKSPDSAHVCCDFRLSWWASACSQWWTSWWWRNQAAALKRSVSHYWQKTVNELEVICSRRNICFTQLISIPPWILISSSTDAEEATQRLHLPSR